MKLIAPLLIGATLVTGATAATVVLPDVTKSVTSSGTQYSFAKFDQRLGTLNSVTLTIVSSVDSGSFSVTNNAATAARVKLPVDRFFVVDDLTGGTDLSYDSGSVDLVTSPATTGAGDSLASGETKTYTLTDKSLIGGTAQDFDLTSALTSYQDATGADTVSFTASNAANATVTGGNFSLNADTVANSTTLRMTYTYTAVPEPSVAMLGGLGGLALLRRRRN
jgi:MYXO-CTERM domain-containing protein